MSVQLMSTNQRRTRRLLLQQKLQILKEWESRLVSERFLPETALATVARLRDASQGDPLTGGQETSAQKLV